MRFRPRRRWIRGVGVWALRRYATARRPWCRGGGARGFGCGRQERRGIGLVVAQPRGKQVGVGAALVAGVALAASQERRRRVLACPPRAAVVRLGAVLGRYVHVIRRAEAGGVQRVALAFAVSPAGTRVMVATPYEPHRGGGADVEGAPRGTGEAVFSPRVLGHCGVIPPRPNTKVGGPLESRAQG